MKTTCASRVVTQSSIQSSRSKRCSRGRVRPSWLARQPILLKKKSVKVIAQAQYGSRLWVASKKDKQKKRKIPLELSDKETLSSAESWSKWLTPFCLRSFKSLAYLSSMTTNCVDTSAWQMTPRENRHSLPTSSSTDAMYFMRLERLLTLQLRHTRATKSSSLGLKASMRQSHGSALSEKRCRPLVATLRRLSPLKWKNGGPKIRWQSNNSCRLPTPLILYWCDVSTAMATVWYLQQRFSETCKEVNLVSHLKESLA